MGLSCRDHHNAGETGPEVTRFAPSPTGYLHLGHAFAAWTAWRRARKSGGRFLLRIEDIDPERCQARYTDAIMEDLHWLGLHWDGPVLVQSAELARYGSCLDALLLRELVYPCFCSRAEIRASVAAPHGPEGPAYPGTCRRLGADERAARLAAGQPHAMRLDATHALASGQRLVFTDEHDGEVTADPAAFGDVVLGRRDVPASYHLCVAHDDARQGVTLVTRADDLRGATHLHRLLQHLMGWPVPRYAHHALLMDGQGQRLSKRGGARPLRDLRAQGIAPHQVIDTLAGRNPATP